MTLLTPQQLDRAHELLSGILADTAECALGDACRRLEWADRHEKSLAGKVTRRLVSILLRRLGFAAAGKTGTGYDRDTLYRKVG